MEITVAKFDAMLMMFAEGVHRLLQVVRYQELIALNASATLNSITGYQGRSPWLVSAFPCACFGARHLLYFFRIKTFGAINDKSGSLPHLFVDPPDILPQNPDAHELDPAKK